MADKAPGGPQATDHFSLGANFAVQTSNNNDTKDVYRAFNGDGDEGCVTTFNNRNEYTASYVHCGSDLDTDLGTLLTAFGGQHNSIQVTDVSISFSADSHATIDVTGHQHDSNAHSSDIGQANLVSVIPDGFGGVGVPAFWSNADANSTPVSATLNLTLEHFDQIGADGEHFAGANTRIRAELSVTYAGAPTLTTTGWTVSEEDLAESNEEFDTTAITADKYFDQA